MRGFPSSVTDIRKKVFTEVARLAYDGDYDRMEDLPYVMEIDYVRAYQKVSSR